MKSWNALQREGPMKALEKRLQKLEEVAPADLPPTTAVVVYDSTTGQPLAPVPATVTTAIWIPDNGRG